MRMRREVGNEKVVPARDGGFRGVSGVRTVSLQDISEEPFAGSESLGRFNGSAAFASTQYPINPGQAATFPVLSIRAATWEKYVFDKLEFEFRTTINEFQGNALGRVILGVDYDASDPPPATRSQAENSRPVVAEAPYIGTVLRLKTSDMHDVCKYHFVRPGSLPGGADIKLYDVGNLNVSTDGNVNANEVGELWVHYRGRFRNQVLESLTTAPTNNQAAQFTTSGSQTATSGVKATMLLSGANPINGLAIVNTAGSMVPPAGNYLIFYNVTGTTTSGSVITAVDVYKNGATIFPTLTSLPTNSVSGQAANVAGMSFVSANGTDAFTLESTISGAGTLKAIGVFSWLSV